jgi:hypothetical protein
MTPAELAKQFTKWAKKSGKNPDFMPKIWDIGVEAAKKDLQNTVPVRSGALLKAEQDAVYSTGYSIMFAPVNLTYPHNMVDEGWTHWYSRKWVPGRFYRLETEANIARIVEETFEAIWFAEITENKYAYSGITGSKLKGLLRQRRAEPRVNTTGQFVTIKYVPGGRPAGAIVIPRGFAG